MRPSCTRWHDDLRDSGDLECAHCGELLQSLGGDAAGLVWRPRPWAALIAGLGLGLVLAISEIARRCTQ